MASELLTTVLIAWIVGLVTIPAWVYLAGWVAARARSEMEAPYRNPGPPSEVVTAQNLVEDRQR